MPISVYTTKTWKYQLREDRMPDGSMDPDGTIFELGALTPRQEALVQDSLVQFAGEGEGQFSPGKQALAALRYGLRGWENFPDADGNDVRWTAVPGKPKECAEECLVHLRREHRTELAEAILERVRVEVPEAD